MFRFISILLLIGGMLVAGLGGAMLLEMSAPRAAEAAYETTSAPVSYEDAPILASAPESAESPPPERVATDEGTRGLGEDTAPEAVPESAPVAETQDEFAFQPMMESMPGVPAPAFEDDAGLTPTEDQYAAAGEAAAAMEEATARQATATAATPSFIESLKTVPIAHETPRSAEYKRPFDVTFAIDATGDDTAVDAMPGRGVIETGEARVSDEVEVRLSGANFTILATSPPVQWLSPLTENTWRWSVTPLTAGSHDLVFEVFALADDNTVPLRTFRDTVTVKVTGLNRAIAFADQANPLFVLLGGLGSAIAGLFGAIKFFGRK